MSIVASLILVLILVHLGLLLGVAGAVKAADLGAFTAQLSAHELVPARLVRLAAFTTPAAEVSVGLWLLSGIQPRLALLSGTSLLGVFLVYRLLMRLARVRTPCGCFGSATQSEGIASAEAV